MINSRQTSLFVALSALCVLSVTSLVGCGELGPFGLQLTNKGTVERDRVVEPGDQGGTVSRPGTSGPGNGAQGNGGVKPGTGVQEPTEPENGNGEGKPGTGEHGDGNGGQGDGGVKPGTGVQEPTKPENGNGGQGNGGAKRKEKRSIALSLCFSGGKATRVGGGVSEYPLSYVLNSNKRKYLNKLTVDYASSVLSLKGQSLPAGYGCVVLFMHKIVTSGELRPSSFVTQGGVSRVSLEGSGVDESLHVYYSDSVFDYSAGGVNLTQLDYKNVPIIGVAGSSLPLVYATMTNGQLIVYGPPNFEMEVEVP